jgi:hypothetical protein
MTETMDPANYAFADGMRVTRATLQTWNRRPGPIVVRWVLGSIGAALLLLVAVLVIGAVSSGAGPAEINQPPFQVGTFSDVAQILSRNVLVLALHAFACVAGFIAGAQLPIQAAYRTGWRRTAYLRAGRVATGFVLAAIGYSLLVEADTIGQELARVALALHASPALLLVAILPHAIPELTAMFLPLAAWAMAARHGDWDQLLAATAVTTAIGLPLLLICACWEVYVAPHMVLLVVGHA